MKYILYFEVLVQKHNFYNFLHRWHVETTCIYSVKMFKMNICLFLCFLTGLFGNFKFKFVAHIHSQCPISVGKHCVRGTR